MPTRFPLSRRFTLASLMALIGVAAVIFHFHMRQSHILQGALDSGAPHTPNPLPTRITETAEGTSTPARVAEATLAIRRAEQEAMVRRAEVTQALRNQALLAMALLLALHLALLGMVRRAQRQMERQAHESDVSRQRLAQVEKLTSLGHMVASVAHQLNAPLAFSKSNVFMAIQSLDAMLPTVESSARMLEREFATDPEATQPHELNDHALVSTLRRIPDEMRTAQEMLGDVLMGMDQMHELVDNLRHFSRADGSRLSRVQLNSALSSVAHIVRSVISNKVRVVEVYEELPQIECQASQLNQVFLNLILNAAQAIRGSGTVTVSTEIEDECICVSVVDTGRGIAPDALPHIFEPYFTTKPAGEGTGLGLAIAQDIVAAHGGRIEVDTQVGVGSRFRVFLPLSAGSAS